MLLDINMPVMDGFEFLDAFANLEITQKESVVIVMLTTSLNPKDMDRLKEAPIQGFLNKPLTEEMVGDLLATHFHGEQPC
ncbi:response regulator [Rhodocytophaga aerolata]|uniref:Response regulator n=1 Tax=Rhodocytophaga aerolata TaxID=455078 RepID=A0ABT8RIU9_9BACT|nr:response regulator [Rhodocytophaga aerolata]MDO1452031.1 response regulator [Rhodocytophaga aerolata]